MQKFTTFNKSYLLAILLIAALFVFFKQDILVAVNSAGQATTTAEILVNNASIAVENATSTTNIIPPHVPVAPRNIPEAPSTVEVLEVDGAKIIVAQKSTTTHKVSNFDDGKFNQHEKKLFLSPNRQLLAITVEPNGTHGSILTYITDLRGNKLTSPYPGSFISWSPDNKKVLLFLSGFENDDGRRIYYLYVDGKYHDSGLPEGVINADISPQDGSIVYSLTGGGTDKSTIYVRDPQGHDKLLVSGVDNIFAWVRWSPKGDRIAFLKSDLYFRSGQQTVWIMNSDGAGLKNISSVVWNYPPVWSPDGTKVAFGNSGDVWEYNVLQSSLRNVTNFGRGLAQHPNYSEDGKTVIFLSDVSGKKQIWAARDGDVVQLTTNEEEKGYPILP